MSQNVFVRAFLVALLLLPTAIVRLAHADPAPFHVAIKIYDGALVDEATRTAAIETASAIVVDSSIGARWYDCTGDAVRRHCDHSRDARTLIIRIVPAFVPGTMGARGAVEMRTDADDFGLILGFAVVQRGTGSGRLATIFMDRVHALAQRTSVPVSALLGRAIAHEVGHLLLGTNAHSRSGLMREVWTDAELALDRRDDWIFGPSDRRVLQAYAGRP